MKKVVLFFSFLIYFTGAYAEKWIPIQSDSPSAATIELVSSTIETSVIIFRLDGYSQSEVSTPRGEALIISVGESSPMLEAGAPDLGKLTTSLIIPDRALMQLEIISATYKEFGGVEVAPSKGNFTRDIDPATVPYTYGTVYGEDAFFPGKLADVRDPYIIRDYRGQTIIAYPFQYNPVTKKLRVYTEIKVRLSKAGDNGPNPLIRNGELTRVDRDFNLIYNRHFLNSGQMRYEPVEEEGNMLIISYGDFMDEMEPFVEWKTLMGRPVEMVDVATIGASSAIKTYIANYYNTYGLTYVLLVGDASQVPTSYASGDSDNDYSYIVGSDHYPDLFMGRFSAENGDQVATQVTRSVNYEKYPSDDPDWYTRNVGIASSQGPGDDGEMDYQHIRNAQTDLMNFTYEYNAELFDGSQGGNDASGNPNPSMVAAEVNTGTSIIIYCGHGSVTSWSTSGFSNSDINNSLTNNDMLPFIWSVACVNGDFNGNTCFAEAWMRATHDGQPKGAIATLMSTINQSWNPPMEGQDEMVDLLVESYSNNIKRTFGGLSMNGCMKMNDTYGSGGNEMTDTWTCFGDPSIVVRTAAPDDMSIYYQNPIPMGSTQMTVSTDVSDGLVCLSYNGEIVATALISSGGTASLTFPPINSLQPRQVTVTSFNKNPYLGSVQISGEPAPASSPYPTNNCPNALPFTQLRWSKGPGGIPDFYKVYFGTNNPPSNIVNGTTVYDTVFTLPEELGYETQYFWRIKSFNQYGDAMSDTWTFTVGTPPDEDFESGNFENYDWYFGGDVPWQIDNDVARHGNYSAASGNVATGMSSSLKIDYEYQNIFSLSISFYFKVSSLEGQNKLQFIVDETVLGEWSGEAGWTNATINVPPGLHTYEWKYLKTADAGTEEDRAWIDYIVFPTPALPIIVNAGGDDIVCEAENYLLEGAAVNYATLLWTTSGDGVFDDNTILNPIYTPGVADIENGAATLTLTAFRDNLSKSDNLVLGIQHAPVVWTGNASEICEGTTFNCPDASADFCASLQWSTSGDGTFDDETIVHPVYTPGPTDIEAETVTLTLTGTGISPCGGAAHSIPVAIKHLPLTPDGPDGPIYIDLYYTPSSTYTTEGGAYALYYSWSIQPGFAGQIDSDGTECVVTWNPEFLGVAEISVKSMNDCGESSYSTPLEVIVNNTVGFDDNNTGTIIRIQPNPNQGRFQAEITGLDQDRVSLRILDATGNIIIDNPSVSVNGIYSETFNLRNKGVYFIHFTGTDWKEVRKIVVQ
jgi:hypothetical protein